MQVPACCPHCDEAFVWELDLRIDRELGWAAPHSPSFLFRCASCQSLVRISIGWRLEPGLASRPLRLVGGPTALSRRPRIVLVDRCPHGCGTRLGLELEPEDPVLAGKAWPDQPLVLGGYRCPCCDGEGVLRVQVEVTAEAD